MRGDFSKGAARASRDYFPTFCRACAAPADARVGACPRRIERGAARVSSGVAFGATRRELIT